MNAFYQALQSGYPPEEILKYLSKAIPQMADPIRKASKVGYTTQQILGFLSKTFDNEDRSGMSETERHSANARIDAARTKFGLKMAASAVVAPLASRVVGNALSRALPQSLGNFSSSQANQNTISGMIPNQQQPSLPQQTETQPIGMQQQNISQEPPISPTNIAQPVQPIQSEVKSINIDEILNKHKSKEKVDQLLKAGNDPEKVSAFFQKFSDPTKKAIEKDAGMPFEDVVKDYISKKPIELEEQPKEIKKAEEVATPHGIGEVKEVRNGKAIVEINGKKHQVPVEELEQEPEEIKSLDLEDAVSDYLSRIPEGEKSSVIDVSLYDPTTNELQVRFPNGDQWIYSDIPQEVFEKINSMTGIPITSGESKLRGTIWDSGTPNSAGADFFKLVKKLVKEGKVKERKLLTGIDLFKGFNRVKKRK